MKHIFQILLVALIAVFTVTICGKAQNVVRNGYTFESVSKKSEPIKTKYVYKDRNGVSYPIYISEKGKAFIIMKSKRTGKEYRHYMPEITKQLQNEKIIK